jgi:two-component system cell cycle response regulator DivK
VDIVAIALPATIRYAEAQPTKSWGSVMSSLHRYVLVADDAEDGRQMLAEYFAFCGISSRVAAHGHEALEIAFAEPPAVVLMDLTMPGLDGWEATRRLKADKRTEKSIVVAVSAHAFSSDKDKALRNGADAFVAKPYDIVRLGHAMRSILSTGRDALNQLEGVSAAAL